MKKILTLIIMISALLSQGVVYLDYGMNSEYEVSNNYTTQSVNLDAPISIGYYYPVYRVADNMIFSAGGSYEIVPAVEKSYGETFEIGFMALYGALGYTINDQMSAWASLGLSMPTSDDLTDIDDIENGMHMGFGVSYVLNSQISLSAGFVSNSATIPQSGGYSYYGYYYNGNSGGDTELNVSKMILSVGYRL